jgi:hypothetical protein
VRALAVAAVLAVLLASGCSDDDAPPDDPPAGPDGTLPDGWDLYTDDDSGLSFALPDEPETTTQPLSLPDAAPVDIRMYAVDRGDWAIIVGLNEVPATGFDLVGAVRGAVEIVDGTLVESSSATVSGRQARDAEVRFETGPGDPDGLFFLRVLLIDGTTVQFQTIGSIDDRDAMLADHEVLRSVVLP